MIVALYIRVSTQEQANEGYSIGEQTERLHKYADAMQWRVYDTYIDGGFTGADTNRPALQKMIRDIEAGYINKVVVYKLDRLSRSQRDTLMLIEDIFLKNNCDFVSMNENFDTSTPFGRAMIGILAVFAQLEREQIKERMNMGKVARAKSGKYFGGRFPFGYDSVNGELVINDFEAMQIREIFKMALDGLSAYTIAEKMQEKGYKTRLAEYRASHVWALLRSKIYIGYIKYGGEWHKGIHEPIIDNDTFSNVQKIINDRSEAYLKHNRNRGKATTYLGGFLVCGRCGAKYTKNVQSTTRNGHHYKYHVFCCNSRTKRGKKNIIDPNCKNKNWKADELTGLIMDEIKKLALDPSYIRPTKPAPDNNDDKIIETQIKNIEAQLSKLLDLYTIGQMPLDLLQTKIKALDAQKNKLENELQAVKDRRGQTLTIEQTAQIVKDFPAILERGNLDEVRAIIGELIEKIVLDGDDISIYWRF